MLQPAALSGQSFCRSGELLQEGQAQGSPPTQKSAAPGTAVIAPAVSHSAGTATSVPSVTGLTAPSHALLTPATTALTPATTAPTPAPTHPPRACQLTNRHRSLLLSFLHSHYLWLVAVCRLVVRHFLVPGFPQLFCTCTVLPSLALTPRCSPTRPPVWPLLPPPAAVSLIKL